MRSDPHLTPRLVLFPGLAADARLFEPQRRAFPQLEVPPWLMPLADERLESLEVTKKRRR